MDIISNELVDKVKLQLKQFNEDAIPFRQRIVFIINKIQSAFNPEAYPLTEDLLYIFGYRLDTLDIGFFIRMGLNEEQDKQTLLSYYSTVENKPLYIVNDFGRMGYYGTNVPQNVKVLNVAREFPITWLYWNFEDDLEFGKKEFEEALIVNTKQVENSKKLNKKLREKFNKLKQEELALLLENGDKIDELVQMLMKK